ncbi:uncharacterized protein LOC114262977 [Camellia sinensis]|uniref:uncharacterized protein LOC114262977 n=1 Tax=Camellia sinensis TaxID=4442 RepID=UPI001036E120|nr:uncharacterized protein LOC114262977 [Camellia sinensis]
MEDDRNWGPKLFKFINAWVLHPKFLGDAKKVWDSTNIHGWAFYIIMEKLRTLKVALKKWNVEVFGDVELELKEAESVLHSMDLQSEVRELTEEEEGQRKEVRGLIWKLSKRKEWMWMQKSRLDWALKGNRNTRFFHIMATKKHNRNVITSVLVNGVEVDEPIEVKYAACYHFQNLFTEHWWFRPSIGGDFKKIAANQVDAILEREFSEEEVWADEFNSNCKLRYAVNFSFVALIPQKENPTSFLDYRPISLINSPSKVLSKVFASRMKQVLSTVIDKAQSTFVGRRNILDGVLIANEVVDWWKTSKKKGIILKLDFQKAYDTKGLKQGDPLSPFLFNVVAEGLNILLSRAKELRIIK